MNRFFILSAFLVFSGAAIASDPTPLFIIFIAWPMIAISIVLFLVVFFMWKNALTSNLVFLFWHFLVIAWASDVGYMKAEGGWIWFSLAINIASIIFWFSQDSRKNGNHENT